MHPRHIGGGDFCRKRGKRIGSKKRFTCAILTEKNKIFWQCRSKILLCLFFFYDIIILIIWVFILIIDSYSRRSYYAYTPAKTCQHAVGDPFGPQHIHRYPCCSGDDYNGYIDFYADRTRIILWRLVRCYVQFCCCLCGQHSKGNRNPRRYDSAAYYRQQFRYRYDNIRRLCCQGYR